MKKLLPHLFSIKIELVFVTVKLYDEGSILSDVSIEFLIFVLRRNPDLISGNKDFKKLLIYYQGLNSFKHSCGSRIYYFTVSYITHLSYTICFRLIFVLS